jgi:hypothetical protein
MKNELKQYIARVIEEVKNSSIKDYNLEAFNSFESFDFINFHLLNKHIFENGTEDLFIGIPEDDYREHFFESIFYAVSLVKLFQNYCSYQQEEPVLRTGDVIFSKGRLYTFLGKQGNQILARPKFDNNNSNTIKYLNGTIATKLDSGFDFQTRKTVECLQGFSDFLNSAFNTSDFPLLTQFAHKTLIISDKKLTRINEYIPFRYHSKNGKDNYKLPFDSVIEICNSYTVAESLIESEKIDQHFDEIIIIGDAKYRDEIFPNIQNGKWNGNFNSIVLIGTNKPSIQHVFKQWNWTKREIIIANNYEPNEVMGLLVEDEELNAIIIELDSFLQSCKSRHSLDIQYLLKFTNYFLRQIIGDVETVAVNFDNYLARVRNHLSSHDFESLVFSAPNINYSNQTKDDIIEAAYSYFEKMAALLLVRNRKWQKIIQLAAEGNPFSLLVDGRDYETVSQQIKKAGISSIKIITTKHSSQLTFDKWLDDVGRHINKRNLVIPYLNNISLYNKLLEIKGQVYVMGYDKLDAQILTNIKAKEDNELAKHINHPDRSLFIKSKLKVDINEMEKSPFYKNIFEFPETALLSKRYTRDGDPSGEDVFYEVTFDNGFTDVLQGSKRVIWMDVDSSTDLTIQECFVGAVIKYYKNESRELFNELLRIKDSGNVLGNINEFAKLWRMALGKLQQQYPNLERLYKEIFQGNGPIQFQAFKSYFSPDSKTVFPQSEVLEAIYRIFKRNGYSDNEFTKNYQAIKTAASQHISIKVKFGRQLSKLLSEGVDFDLKELLSEMDELPIELKERLGAFIKSGTIKIIKPISVSDERILAKSTANI